MSDDIDELRALRDSGHLDEPTLKAVNAELRTAEAKATETTSGDRSFLDFAPGDTVDPAHHFADVAHARDVSRFPSAGGLPENYRPPEALPTAPAPGLKGILQMLPAYIGGGTKLHQEPVESDFVKANGRRPTPDELHDFQDATWKKVHDDAIASGTPTVRVAYMDRHPGKTDDSLVSKADLFQLGDDVLGDGAKAMAGGADMGLTGGIGRRLVRGATEAALGPQEDIQASMDRHPILSGGSALAAMVAGAPISLPAQIGEAVTKGVGPATSALGRLLKGAGAGALSGLGAGLLEDTAKGVDDVAHGQSVKDAIQAASDRTGAALPGRLGVGAGLGLLGGAAGALKNHIDESPSLGLSIKALKGSGGAPRLGLNPVRNPPAAQENLDASLGKPGAVSLPGRRLEGMKPEDIAAARAAPKVVAGVDEADQGMKDLFDPQRAAFLASPEGSVVKRPLTNTLQKTVDTAIERSSADTGEPLEWTKGRDFREHIPQLFDGARVVQNFKAVEAKKAGAVVLPLDDPRVLSLFPAETSKVTPNQVDAGYRLVLWPTVRTAKEFDVISKGLDNTARIDRATPGVPGDEAFKGLTKAIRQDQDKFPWNEETLGTPHKATLEDETQLTGWSALKHAEHEALNDHEAMVGRLGLRGTPTQRMDAAEGQALGYRTPGHGPKDEALHQAVGGFRPDEPRALADINGTRATQYLRGALEVPQFGMRGAAHGIGLRAYTPLEKLAAGAPKLAAGAGHVGKTGMALGEATPEALQALKDRVTRLLSRIGTSLGGTQ